MDNAAILTVASRPATADNPPRSRLQSVIVVQASPLLGRVVARHAATAAHARRLVTQPFGIASVHRRPTPLTGNPRHRRVAIAEPAYACAYRDPMRSCRLPDAIRDRTTPATDRALRAALADTWTRARRIHPASLHYAGVIEPDTGTVTWNLVSHPAAGKRPPDPLETRVPELQPIPAEPS